MLGSAPPMLRRAAPLFVALILGCPGPREDRGQAVAPASSSAAAGTDAKAPSASASEVFARTVCDHYWKFTSTAARPYDSLGACIAAETLPRPCSVEQAQACAAFAEPLRPGAPGNGLLGSADCAACLNASPAAGDAYAEQRAALERATLAVHSATLHTAAWPADIAPQKNAKTVLVKVDVSLTGYGYRIDPDDFVLVLAGESQADAVSSGPYTERLSSAGKPVAWDDPSVRDDPDLRIVAFFPLPATARQKPLAVGYAGKVSTPFQLR